MKAGDARFFEEAKKYGLERDEDSLGRLKFVDEKMKPTDEEIRKLYGTTESFGITQLEFSWGKKLTGV